MAKFLIGLILGIFIGALAAAVPTDAAGGSCAPRSRT